MKKILVLGGSGFVGRHVCEKLVAAGFHVTVPTRRRERAKLLLTLPHVDVVQADVHDGHTLMQLLKGQDAVVHLVAILHGSAQEFQRVHVRLTKELASACMASGVQRVVHMSALGADTQGPSMYQRSKGEAEVVWQASGLNVTVLRPSVIFGAEDQFLNLFASLQKVFPVMPLAGAQTKFQPVWVEDVAAAVVASLQDLRSIGKTYECAGPDVYTLRELVKRSAQWAGVCGGWGRPLLPLPQWLGRVQAALLELAPGPTLMSRDNIDSMQVDNVATGALPQLEALGIHPTPLAAIAPQYLGQGSPRSRFNDFRRQPRA